MTWGDLFWHDLQVQLILCFRIIEAMTESNSTEETGRKTLFEGFEPATYAAWKAETERLLKGAPFDKVMRKQTLEGITLEPIYDLNSVSNLPHLDQLPGVLGARGSRNLGYRDQVWESAQEIFEPTAAAANAAVHEALLRGGTALVLPLDYATSQGLDFGTAAPGTIGSCGTPIQTAADFRSLLAGVDPVAAPVYFRGGRTAPLLAPLFRSFVEEGGFDLRAIRGSIGYDPVGDAVVEGALPLAATVERWIGELACEVGQVVPGLKLLRADGLLYRNAGANAIEEVAAVLATANHYISILVGNGMTPADASGRIEFAFALGGDFFMEIAKLRAARIVWGQILAQWGVDPKEARMHLSARTSIYNKTRRDPYVNMLRATTEALSGVIGGVDTLTVGCFDEVVRHPATFCRRIARNLQLILAEECELTKVIDPGGGSWYLENLTDQVGRGILDLFRDIEAEGGILETLTSGTLQQKIAATDRQARKLLGQRRHSLVGTNVYPNLGEKPLPETARVAGPQPVSDNGSGNGVTDLAGAGQALATGATVSAVAGALKMTEGFVGVEALPCRRLAMDYERLRDAAETHAAKEGQPPRIALVTIGALKFHKVRADFTRAFFEAGGFEVLQNDGTTDPAEAVERLRESGARIAVVCGTDEQYGEHFEALAKAIKVALPSTSLVLAGTPGDRESAFREAGMDDFIFVKSPHYETNLKYLRIAGVAVDA